MIGWLGLIVLWGPTPSSPPGPPGMRTCWGFCLHGGMPAGETLSAVPALWLQSRDDTRHGQTAIGAAVGDGVGFPWEAVAVLTACSEWLQLGTWGADLLIVRFLVWWSFSWTKANEEKSVGQVRTYAEQQGWGWACLTEVLFAGWVLTRWQSKTLKSLALHYDGLHLLQLLLLHQEALLQIHLDGIHAAVLRNEKPHAENTRLTWSNAIGLTHAFFLPLQLCVLQLPMQVLLHVSPDRQLLLQLLLSGLQLLLEWILVILVLFICCLKNANL